VATRHLHVFRRNSIYWWRRRVPLILRRAVGRVHLARSLRTADPTEARRRARRLSSRIDELFAEFEHIMTESADALTPKQIDAVLDALFKQTLDDGPSLSGGIP
jgi:hypothetical protein